jgi:glycosyltransferase involved in cell wall biosynthesis
MAVAEAIAGGLPVVSTPTGAIPDLVGKDAGILVPPGNVNALADALERMLGDAHARRQFTQGARRRRMQLPAWSAAVRKWKAVLQGVAAE